MEIFRFFNWKKTARKIGGKALLFALVMYVLITVSHNMEPVQIPYHSAGTDSVELQEAGVITLSDIPEYTGEPYVVINGNIPFFTAEDITDDCYENYSELDRLGRCGVAMACVGEETMPTENRDEILNYNPTGWKQAQYDFIEYGFLYNRCHLIGYQLTAENTNERNLITGTRYFNVEGMLPFENQVAQYVWKRKGHVIYRVTPMFDGDDLVAKGVLMEAYSVEDQGCVFCVFVYNVQPMVEIDYATGISKTK